MTDKDRTTILAALAVIGVTHIRIRSKPVDGKKEEYAGTGRWAGQLVAFSVLVNLLGFKIDRPFIWITDRPLTDRRYMSLATWTPRLGWKLDNALK